MRSGDWGEYHHLLKSAAFVAIISLSANAATDFGQACPSRAEPTATEATRDLEPGPQALKLLAKSRFGPIGEYLGVAGPDEPRS